MKTSIQALLLLFCVSFAGLAFAAQPTRYGFAPAADGLPTASLNQSIVIEFPDGDRPSSCDGVVLTIGNSSKLSTVCRAGAERQFIFKLGRNGDNQGDWQDLLGKPFSGERVKTLPIAMRVGNQEMAFFDAARPDAKPLIAFERYSAGGMALGAVAVMVVIIITAASAGRTVMIRDMVIPQMTRAERPFSLGRTQMAFWFCLIFASFIFILIVTDDLNSLNADSFILLGLSSATALGAVAIDQTKDGQIGKVEDAVTQLGLATQKDVEELHAKAANQTSSTLPASTTIASAPVGLSYAQLLEKYEAAIEPIRSHGFIKDLVSDINGPTLHRWQIIVWTLVLGTIYIWKVYSGLETPSFGTNLLAVMGISSGVYLIRLYTIVPIIDGS